MTSVKRSLNVGVVGMGRMGVPITRNLAFKSRNAMYLQLHSRSLNRVKEVSNHLQLDGAQCAMRLHNRYATMTKWCDVIITALADVKASRYAMLEAPDALLRFAREGQVIVEHTTLDRETALEYSSVAASKGAIFLDAPMSGNPQSALNGQLTLMVGGENDSYLRVLPLFRLYADTIHRMGHCGSGSATKGIISMLVAAHSVAAAEALQMAHATGIDSSDNLLKVLDSSWGSSTMLRRNAACTQRLLRNPEQSPPISSSTINSLLNDLGMLDGQGAIFNGATINSSRTPLEARHMSMGRPGRGNLNNDDEDGDGEGIVGHGEELHYPVLHNCATMLSKAAVAGLGDRDIAGIVNFLEAGAQGGVTTMEESEEAARAVEEAERMETQEIVEGRGAAVMGIAGSALGRSGAGGVVPRDGKHPETRQTTATHDEEMEFY